MNGETTHLNGLLPETRTMIDKSDKERIDYIKVKKYIPYPQAVKILDRMEELLEEPKSDRMPNILIVGSSNNGKTSIAKEFLRRYPPTDGIKSDALPVVYIQMPSGPDEGRFYTAILERLVVPFKHKDTPARKLEMVSSYFTDIGVKMLIVDEIHNTLRASIAKQGVLMNSLKNLSNEIMIPLVLIGTKDALRSTNTDVQISSRFPPMFLTKWKLNAEYVRLLASLEQTLPLKKPSGLATKDLALEILDLSDRIIGDIVELINMAAMMAIKNGTERISLIEIKGCGFIKPSKRRNIPELEDI